MAKYSGEKKRLMIKLGDRLASLNFSYRVFAEIFFESSRLIP
jgi:hypothetical protein